MPLFPKGIDTFYDVFGGSGVVVINAEAKRKIYNEVDVRLVDIIKYLKSCPSIEVRKQFNKFYKQHFNGCVRSLFDYVKKEYNNNRDCRLLWYTSFMAFSNKLTFNKKGELNCSFGKRLSLEKLKHIDNFNDIEITENDYMQCLFIEFTENDFVFMDPPYYLSEMHSSKGSYNSKWNDSSESSLLNLLRILYDNDIKFGLTNIVEYKGHVHLKLIELIDELSLNTVCISKLNNANGVVNTSYKELYIYNYEVEE